MSALGLRDRLPLNPSQRGAHTAELRELEPNILPAQRRALEAVAARLGAERPVADPDFRAELDHRIRDLAGAARDAAPRTTGRLWIWIFLASGLALLLLAVALVVIGEPGGR